MYVFVSGSEHLLCVDSKVCGLSGECGAEGLRRFFLAQWELQIWVGGGDSGGGDFTAVGWPKIKKKEKENENRPEPLSLCRRYSIPLWRLNSTLSAYSECLLVFLLCILLLQPLQHSPRFVQNCLLDRTAAEVKKQQVLLLDVCQHWILTPSDICILRLFKEGFCREYKLFSHVFKKKSLCWFKYILSGPKQ